MPRSPGHEGIQIGHFHSQRALLSCSTTAETTRFQRTLFAGQRAKLVYQHCHNDFPLYASRSANLIISCGM